MKNDGNMRHRLFLIVVAVFLSAGLPAFGQSTMPSIYVDSRLERLLHGVNVLQNGYQTMLETCQAAGLPTSALSGEEVSLLGTTRLQRWFEADAFAFREETWTFHIAGQQRDQMCQFSLAYEGRHGYADRQDYLLKDLESGEVESRPFADPDIFDRNSLEGRQVTGESVAAAGQSCMRHEQLPFEVCIWNAGEAWGFRASPGLIDTSGIRQMNSRLVLVQEPVTGTGMRMVTDTFTIGQHTDHSAMRP